MVSVIGMHKGKDGLPNRNHVALPNFPHDIGQYSRIILNYLDIRIFSDY